MNESATEKESSTARRAALVTKALKLARQIAVRLHHQLGGRYSVDDLVGFAHEAVVDVVARFDPSRGQSLEGFARLRLRGAMFDGVRRGRDAPRAIQSRLAALAAADSFVRESPAETSPSTPSARDADARLARYLRGVATAYFMGHVGSRWPHRHSEPISADDPETNVHRRQVRAHLDRALVGLDATQSTLLRLHYFRGEDLQTAGMRLGLSKSWASRVHARAIEQLGERLSALRACGDL